jgi:hypothetical protein
VLVGNVQLNTSFSPLLLLLVAIAEPKAPLSSLWKRNKVVKMGSEKAADASVPLTEENVAEALQAIKDARK